MRSQNNPFVRGPHPHKTDVPSVPRLAGYVVDASERWPLTPSGTSCRSAVCGSHVATTDPARISSTPARRMLASL